MPQWRFHPAPQSLPDAPTVFVVDDDPEVLSGVRMLLESRGRRVETFSAACDFLKSYHAERPGCLIADLMMPAMDGLQLQQRLTSRGVSLPIIFLSGQGEIPLAVQALRRGAMDFLEKPFKTRQLLQRVSEAIAADAEIRHKSGNAKATRRALARLSPREHEILARFMAGDDINQTADRIGINFKTVYGHRKRLMRKLGVRSLVALFRMVADADPRLATPPRRRRPRPDSP